MSVDLLVADALRDRLDAEGRPLGEQSSPLYPPTREVVCPYSGSRQGRPMNADALAQISARWPELLADLARLQAGDATVRGAWRACLAAVVRPHLDPDPVPAIHAAAYKTALGFTQVLTFLLLSEDGIADLPLASLGSARQMAEQIDQGDWLVGQSQACAGSPEMIEQMAHALANPPPAGPLDSELEALVDAAAALIGELLDELETRRTGPATDSRASQVLASGRPSWTRAVTMAPGRRSSDARRLQQGSGGA